jgi:serine phosphatase RsbU (regulator of sigma subunit)
MILRGDLKKSNIPIHLVTDKKVLQFIPQDLVGEGGEGGGDSEHSTGESSNFGGTNIRKRASLINLSEEAFVLKYCELKAKYDNLLESSSAKIYELTTAKDLVVVPQETEKNNEESIKHDKELISKYEEVIAEKDKLIYDLTNKNKEITDELEGTKSMLDCNLADINGLTERVEKHSKLFFNITFIREKKEIHQRRKRKN